VGCYGSSHSLADGHSYSLQPRIRGVAMNLPVVGPLNVWIAMPIQCDYDQPAEEQTERSRRLRHGEAETFEVGAALLDDGGVADRESARSPDDAVGARVRPCSRIVHGWRPTAAVGIRRRLSALVIASWRGVMRA
jgi:hypothetical protein